MMSLVVVLLALQCVAMCVAMCFAELLVFYAPLRKGGVHAYAHVQMVYGSMLRSAAECTVLQCVEVNA